MARRQHKRTKKSVALSPSRRRVFTIITLSLPFLLLVATEVSLRLFSVGADLRLFEFQAVGGRTYAMVNPAVGGRYFSKLDFKPAVSTDAIVVPKIPGTFRVFCLGASTTFGYPYGPSGSFTTYLRDRLERLFPERRIEVMNLGITATNSFTVLDLGKEVLEYQPDLLIVYDGHNEFYGALGISSRESFAGSRWLTQLYLNSLRFKTFQVLRDLYNDVRQVLSNSGKNSGGTMMERVARGKNVPLGSSEYQGALEIYEANMDGLIARAREHHVPIILSTQVSNLRDLKPLVSGFDPDLSSGFQAAVADGMREGARLLSESRPDSALLAFLRSYRLDSTNADLCFRIGQTYLGLGRRAEALAYLMRARDLDQLRFRQSSDFNESVRRRDDSTTTWVVDIESAFLKVSPDSIVGRNLILEHLHPTAYGYFLMADAYAQKIRDLCLVTSLDDWVRRDTFSLDELWNNRILTALDEQVAARRVQYLTSSWPFRSDEVPVTPPLWSDTIGCIVEEVVSGRKTWEQGHVAAAEYYESRRDRVAAAAEYRMLAVLEPYNVSALLLLGRTYVEMNMLKEADHAFQQSLTVEPTVYALQFLATVRINRKLPGEAIPFLERALGMASSTGERSKLGFLLGLALFQSGQVQRAQSTLENVRKIDPGNKQAQQLLQRILQAN